MHQTISGGKQIHIGCARGDLAENLLLPGDPDRVAKIVDKWDEAHQVTTHREFRSFTGKYADVPISALSTGIGPACMAIAVNEAAALGVKTFIRVGSTGSIQKHVRIGDLVIVARALAQLRLQPFEAKACCPFCRRQGCSTSIWRPPHCTHSRVFWDCGRPRFAPYLLIVAQEALKWAQERKTPC